MDAVDDALVFPQIEVVENRGLGRQILGNIAPLAPRAQEIHDPVGDLAQIDRTLAPAAFGRRDQRRDQRPFLMRHLARITETSTVVTRTISRGPHRRAPPNRATPLESQTIRRTQQLSEWTLRENLRALI